MWSLGVVLYEMCALKPPFEATSLAGLSLKIIKGVYPPVSTYSRELQSLLSMCLTVNASRRPSVNQIL